MNSSLSVRECIRYGWTTFKQRPWFLIGTTLLVTVTNAIIPGPKEGQSMPVIAGLVIISILLGALIQLGTTHFALRAHDSIMAARLKDLWRPDLYLRFLGACIIGFVIVGIPLLIVWGIVAALYFVLGWIGASVIAGILALIVTVMAGLTFYFFAYIVIDKQVGPVIALKESLRLTKGHRWKLFQLLIVFILINLLGFVCLFVGLLVSVPITMIATVHAYRALERSESATSDSVSPNTLPVAA
jgi:uncharacterized membrane protein